MIPNYRSIHNRFKINNFHFDKEALYQLAYTLIKEGKDYENDLGVFLKIIKKTRWLMACFYKGKLRQYKQGGLF